MADSGEGGRHLRGVGDKRQVDWNVVVSVRERGFLRTRRLLRDLGRVERTAYRNVLAVTVDDTREFLGSLAALSRESPDLLGGVSRVLPCARTFDFCSPEEFEARACEVTLAWAPSLAGRSFHVRLHRRGLKGRISSQEEERLLDRVLLESLEAAGTPGSITFDDPDAVVDVEIVGHRAGASLWTRADLRRYPFLRVD